MNTPANAWVNPRRRAFILVIVMTAIVLVGAALTVLATWAAQGYRDRQADRARITAQAIADSAAAYARAHRSPWSVNPPEQDVTLDVSALLLPNMEGSAVISFPTIDGRRVCHISCAAEMGPAAARNEIDLSLTAAASRPAVHAER